MGITGQLDVVPVEGHSGFAPTRSVLALESGTTEVTHVDLGDHRRVDHRVRAGVGNRHPSPQAVAAATRHRSRRLTAQSQAIQADAVSVP